MQLNVTRLHGSKIKVGSVYYKVIVKVFKDKNDFPFARLDASNCTLSINMGYNKEYALDSFFHEIIEAIKVQYSLSLSHSNINVLGEAFAAFFVDNKHIWRKK
jgi:hypothetical protein